MVNRTGTELEVPGYSAEPYLRIGPDGVWRNVRSPATYVSLDRYTATGLPPQADPAAAPEWQQLSTEPTYVWHDHRTHWMSQGQLPPVVAADPTTSHTVIEWTVPMSYGGAQVAVHGSLTWSPPPPGWLLWPVYVLLFAAGAAAGWLARSPRPLAVALGMGALASIWHAVATPEPPASVSSHAGALIGALLPALLVLPVAALGICAARRRGALCGLLAVVAGWLMLVQGLPDVDVLWSANVLATGPQPLAHAAVAVLVAAGPGLVVGGAGAARRFRDPAGDRSPAAAAEHSPG
ncbi:hypothetical protein SAMN05661080_02973 [Modestobacter sp. DSM 44400]|uniref:hypothetical protein n=1 Tax=Modestobacter sp. DSM 44400 TaxID=1550230 RepID=UPI00089A627A|nr:hypothetical protein [Modestobacter sp. DSM 44400]SDY28783.1 hypothetical protein SAMN05661080_02973 [Modestobacter sp. DSM 44400]